jgi:ureidoacrylate peracid hydrolase
MLTVSGKPVFSELEEVIAVDHTALLVVDVQNDFVSPGGLCERTGHKLTMMRPVVGRVARLITEARAGQVLIVWIQTTHREDRRTASPAYIRFHALKRGYGWDEESVIEGTWGWRIVDEVAPEPGELVMRKHRSSAVAGTELDLLLRSYGIQTVVLVGTTTHGCIESTARAAEGLDYYVAVVEDACAAFLKEEHEAAILCMSRRYDMFSTDEVAQIWGGAEAE